MHQTVAGASNHHHDPLGLLQRVAASALGAIFVAACVIVRAKMLTSQFPQTRLCPEAVTVFTDPQDVGKPYVEVAVLVPPPGGAEYRPSPDAVESAQRKKAAAIGANGMIVNRGRHEQGYFYDDALAIYIPEDSARAIRLCSNTRPGH